MSAIDQIEQADQQAEADARRDIVQLVHDDASGKKVDPEHLKSVLAILSIDHDTYRQWVAAVQQAARLQQDVRTAEQVAASRAELQKQIEDFRAETRKILEIRDRLFAPLEQQWRIVERAVETAGNARRRIDELRRENPVAFGIDTVADARRRHLAQTIFGQPADATHDVIPLESIMSSPSGNWPLSKFEFAPLPGQSEAELEALLQVAQELTSGRQDHRYRTVYPPGFYLLSDGSDDPRILCCRDRVKSIGELANNPQTDLNAIVFVRAPQQTGEQLQQLIEQLRKDHDKSQLKHRDTAAYGPADVTREPGLHGGVVKTIKPRSRWLHPEDYAKVPTSTGNP
jgi:hypothetical protein